VLRVALLVVSHQLLLKNCFLGAAHLELEALEDSHFLIEVRLVLQHFPVGLMPDRGGPPLGLHWPLHVLHVDGFHVALLLPP